MPADEDERGFEGWRQGLLAAAEDAAERPGLPWPPRPGPEADDLLDGTWTPSTLRVTVEGRRFVRHRKADDDPRWRWAFDDYTRAVCEFDTPAGTG